MIISSITKELDENTNHLPPILDKRKVADTIFQITEKAKIKNNFEPNFDKMYRSNLQTTILNDEKQLDSSLSGWIIIPSKANAPDNFEENVKKLQTLSHDSWCTKTYNAEPYLAKGDFHVYMKAGKAKLGVRFDGDEIQEILGELNNSKIPKQYLDVAKNHVEEKNYNLSERTQIEFKLAEVIRKKTAQIKLEIGVDAFKNKEYDKILSYLGIQVEKDEDGMLALSHYNQPSSIFSFDDLGVDENNFPNSDLNCNTH